MTTRKSWTLVCSLLLAIGCSTDDGPTEQPVNEEPPAMMPETPPAGLTYYQDVKPILDTNCVSCHVEGGPGGFALDTYEAAQPWAMAMKATVEARTMPPWGAFDTDDCSPRFGFKGDMSLSDAEITRIGEWAETGAAAGDPSADTSMPPMAIEGLSEWDFEGSAAEPVSVPTGGDRFVCIVIDPALEEETWLQGIEYIPDNKALVHHVVLFTDPTRASLDRMGEDGTYECFGSAGVPGSFAGGWAPGIAPVEYPDDMAMRIEAGTLFVMQMHYSPQGGAGDLTDQTKVRFKYADSAPRYEVYVQLMGNLGFSFHPAFGLAASPGETSDPEFKIPAGATNHLEINRWTFTGNLPGSGAGGRGGLDEVKLLGITPHMHYAGVQQKVRLERAPANEAACEPGMLTGLMACSQGAGCTESIQQFARCAPEACEAEWNDMNLTCWGCLQTAVNRDLGAAELFTELNRCETNPAPQAAIEQPANECLVSAPLYTFEWQRTYWYDTEFENLPAFTPGNVLSIECTYDNAMSNPLISSALRRMGLDAPEDVVLGDETLDEMCLVALNFAFERRD